MPVSSPRRFSRKTQNTDLKQKEIDVLEHIWRMKAADFAASGRTVVVRSYLNHLNDGIIHRKWPRTVDQVIQLACIVRANVHENIGNLAQSIVNQGPMWFREQLSDVVTATNSIAAMINLLLFTDVKIVSSDQTIAQLLCAHLPLRTAGAVGELSEDFSGHTLARVAGYKFRWTSDLNEHLKMSRNVIKFFRHAAVLDHLKSEHYLLFPPDLLAEVQRSMRLFFPFGEDESCRWSRKIEDRRRVDLEAGKVDDNIERDLQHYPYYGERLMIIQAKYDQSKPHSWKQFWFDRRRPAEWIGLQVAIVSFVVTAVFTIISAVTGILQVLKS